MQIDILKEADILHFQRQYAPESLIILRRMKARGIPCIFQVDDNVWEIPPGNPAKTTYVPGSDVMKRFEILMRESHAVVTSTPYLAQLCQKFNPHVYIFRNLVECDTIAEFKDSGRDNPDEIRIGWIGTPHHYDDIQVVEFALKEILRMFKQVKLVFMGFSPTNKQILHEYLGRWEYYEFVDVDAFYASFASLDFDIGIAPLVDHPFNKGKTARKAQEYAALSVPMILSPMLCYKDWIHGETCLKPKNNKHIEWVKDLVWMIEHPKEREKMAKRANEQVRRDHDINKWIHERAAVYYDVIEKVKKGIYK